MNLQKPRILLVNDDGVDAAGLKHLWRALSPHAEVTVVAPNSEKSGVGLSLTIHHPLHIDQIQWEGDNTSVWKVSGTPADCVRLALNLLYEYPPDLIVSGINRGANIGRNVLYSGTIGGVIEGTLRSVPGVAFSCEDFTAPDYKSTEPYILPIVQHMLKHPMPKGTLLNVNFPRRYPILGFRLAKQGRGYWIEDLEKRIHPEGRAYYWMGLKWFSEGEEAEESDVALLKKGYITGVPIRIDELTDHDHLAAHKPHFDELFYSGNIKI